MKILSENSILNDRTISTARRIVSIAVGATVGISMGLTSVHASQPGTSLLAGFHSVGRLELSSNTPVVIPATQPSVAPAKLAARHVRIWRQVGLASWYGGQFQGRKTANGEIFNMNELSCAHRTLPLGTWVKVTNLHNHRWVVLRVNDRGPVPETRVVDLSSAAAHLLGMRQKGVSRVRLDVIDAKQAVQVARLERLRALRLAAESGPAPQATAMNLPSAALVPATLVPSTLGPSAPTQP